MPEKWTNPLTSPDRLAFYENGDEHEIVFEKKVLRTEKNIGSYESVELVSRRFILELVECAMTDSKSVHLARIALRQMHDFSTGNSRQPTFEEDLFFDFVERLKEIQPDLQTEKFIHSNAEIALIVLHLLEKNLGI